MKDEALTHAGGNAGEVFGWAVPIGILAGLLGCYTRPGIAALVAGGVAALMVVAIWLLRRPGRWVMAFLVACLCLPPLPIAMGNSGPHPALGIAGLGLVAGTVHWRLARRDVPRAALAFPIYAFSLLASIPFAAWFSGPSLAAVSLARFALFGISLCVFFYTLAMPLCASDQLQSLRILFYAGLASASFAVLDFFLQLPAPAGFGAQYVWTAAGIYRRAQGVFYESSTLGNICMFFLLFIAACFARPRNEAPVRRPLLLVGAGVFLAALLLSFSRASLIGLAIGIAALTALQKDWLRMLRLCAVLVGAGLFSLTALYVAMPALVRFYGVRTAASLQLVTSGNERALSGRAETWRVLTAYVRDHPQYAIFGVGYKTLPYSDFIGQTTVADNSYLSALVETGILGLGALLILHAGILRMAWKARASLCGIWILSFWSVEMVQMLSGDLFTYWRALPLYFWVLALAVRSEPRRLP